MVSAYIENDKLSESELDTLACFFRRNRKKEENNMADFMIRFLICNILLCGIIGILLFLKRIFKNCLSSRMQYNLWFLLLDFGQFLFAISILKIIRALCMVEKPEPYFHCPNGRSRRSDPSYEHYEHPKLDGRFHPFRKQKNAIYDRLSVTCTLGIRHHCHALILVIRSAIRLHTKKSCLASCKVTRCKNYINVV